MLKNAPICAGRSDQRAGQEIEVAQSSLNALMEGKTVIAIAHRPPSPRWTAPSCWTRPGGQAITASLAPVGLRGCGHTAKRWFLAEPT
jgi:hypothetical protein